MIICQIEKKRKRKKKTWMDVKDTRPCYSMVIHFSICIAPNIMKKILANIIRNPF